MVARGHSLLRFDARESRSVSERRKCYMGTRGTRSIDHGIYPAGDAPNFGDRHESFNGGEEIAYVTAFTVVL